MHPSIHCFIAALALAQLLLLLLLCLLVERVDAQSNVDNLLLETFFLVSSWCAACLRRHIDWQVVQRWPRDAAAAALLLRQVAQ